MKEDNDQKFELSQEDLEFLRDEGLELFALFKRIRDVEKRALVVDLLKALASDQKPTDGST